MQNYTGSAQIICTTNTSNPDTTESSDSSDETGTTADEPAPGDSDMASKMVSICSVWFAIADSSFCT